MGPAAQEVLGLPELLENILQHLDTKQLFVIQRVNTTFNGNVSGSKKLRRIMFLEPTRTDDVTTSTDDATTNNNAAGQERDGMLNPLLAKKAILSVSSFQLSTKRSGRRGPSHHWKNGQFRQVHGRGYEVICVAEAIDENNAREIGVSWRSMVLTKNGLTTYFHVTVKAGHAVDNVTFTVAGTTELGRVADVIGEVYRRFRLRKVKGNVSLGRFLSRYEVLGVEVSARSDLG